MSWFTTRHQRMPLHQTYGYLMQKAALPLLLAPTRSRMTRLASSMRKRQYWPREKLQELQLERLRQVVRIAQEGSEFYSQRFAEAGLNANNLVSLDDLCRFPITTKQDLESHFPEGIVVAKRRSKDWQYVGTRGTTKRVIVVQDFERRDVNRAKDMVALTEDSPYYCGCAQVSIPPDACSVHCGLEDNRAASVSGHLAKLVTRQIAVNRESISDLRGLVMDTWICPNLVLPPLYLDGTDGSLRYAIMQLRKQRPVQLNALPEYLYAMAQYILRSGDQPPPIAVLRPQGANFPAAWKPAIESAFRGKFREHYGSREMGAMAFDCRQTSGLHVLMDQCIFEVVRDGQPVGENEVGKVLITDLANFAMPLIRYDIGDLARIVPGNCPCGRNSMRIALEGRVQDAILTAEGRILTAEAISNFFSQQPEVADFELTENSSGRISLRVVPVMGYEDFDLAVIGDRFLRWSQLSRSISVRRTTRIRPESSGKYRHCRSQSYEGISA